ncbi:MULTISPECIES: DMT family transporter [unclassified Paenibacillus]|uniref:DMT family transporter n=1 Tax=Paenibacillus provencensis TaxID=441151 RepID=A0ABW3PII3_9BACL|nr:MULTISPECIES: DMT family transporter [unclassified Paenibacillus]MCM3126777.1 DMT family transporter [Paenibacillus sp. MER 78]SFS57912.1 transporter family-2 protein [Paenibacillus sp. 453mf]
MALGIILALVAGAFVSLQVIFNSKMNEHTGSWLTTTIVLGLGAIAALTASLIFEGADTFELQHMKPWYWFSGMIGVAVVYSLMQGVKLLGPTFSTSITLTSQLGFAVLFDSLGLFGLEKIDFSVNKMLGVLVIIGGILLFKYGERLGDKKRGRVSE